MAQATFAGLGELPGGEVYSTATAVSASGQFATGCSHGPSGFEAVLWRIGKPPVPLGDLPGGTFDSCGFGVSDQGVVVGEATGTGGAVAFIWNAQQGMRALLGPSTTPSIALAITPSGHFIIGETGPPAAPRAFRWTPSSGAALLGDLPGGLVASTARAVSSGGVVAGSSAALLGHEAFRWMLPTPESAAAAVQPPPGLMTSLGDLPGGKHGSTAWGIAPDGLVVVGGSLSAVGEPEAFRWTTDTGMIGLGVLPGGLDSLTLGASQGGTVLVGRAGAPAGLTAFVWTPAAGMRSLRAELVTQGLNLSGWSLSIAHAVTPDGRTIVGLGSHNGVSEGWVARIPAYCFADCNVDGQVMASDLGCFQTRFVAGDLLYADCTADGLLTVTDWACFQTSFVTGCP